MTPAPQVLQEPLVLPALREQPDQRAQQARRATLVTQAQQARRATLVTQAQQARRATQVTQARQALRVRPDHRDSVSP